MFLKLLYQFLSFNFFLFINLFIYDFWLRWVFIAACGLSLVAASGGYSSLRCMGFSFRWLLLLWSTDFRRAGFSSCSMQAQQLWLAGSRAQAHQLWRMGFIAPQHVGSSWTRARTSVPCIGRWILNHCTTREPLNWFLKPFITDTLGLKSAILFPVFCFSLFLLFFFLFIVFLNVYLCIAFIYLFIFGHAVPHAGSQFPDQGLNQRPLQWKHRVLTTGLPGKFHLYSTYIFIHTVSQSTGIIIFLV